MFAQVVTFEGGDPDRLAAQRQGEKDPEWLRGATILQGDGTRLVILLLESLEAIEEAEGDFQKMAEDADEDVTGRPVAVATYEVVLDTRSEG